MSIFGVGVILHSEEELRNTLCSLAQCSTIPYQLFVNGDVSQGVEEFVNGIVRPYKTFGLEDVHFISGSACFDQDRVLELTEGFSYVAFVDAVVCFTPGWMEHVSAVMTTFDKLVAFSLICSSMKEEETLNIIERFGIAIRQMTSIPSSCVVVHRKRWQDMGKFSFLPSDDGREDFSSLINKAGGWVATPLCNRIHLQL